VSAPANQANEEDQMNRRALSTPFGRSRDPARRKDVFTPLKTSHKMNNYDFYNLIMR
jgi:hypothetical protein